MFSFGAQAAELDIDTKALTRLVTTQIDDLTDVKVVGASEMRDALTLEVEKQAIGCSVESCLAEIASAMGTSHILQMQLGAVGETLLFTAQIFDGNARALSRQSITGKTIDEIGAELRPKLELLLRTAGLLDPPKDGETKNRSLFILDLKKTVKEKRVVEDEPVPPPSLSPLLFAGGAITGVGLIAGGAAGIFAGILALRNVDKENATQHEVLAWQASTWIAAGIFAVVTTGGIAATTAGFFLGE